MQRRKYASLHCHTDASSFRFLDATVRVNELIDKAKEYGLSGVAITEHETTESALEAIEYYFDKHDDKWREDFKLILGNEIYLCPRPQEGEKPTVFPHFILLALDDIGHKCIRELSTRAWVNNTFSYKDQQRVPTYYDEFVEIVSKYTGHVYGSSACLGSSLCTQLLKYRETRDIADYEACKYWIDFIKSVLGDDNFSLELQPSYREEQCFVNKMLIKLSEETNTPYIITTDVHYLLKGDRAVHEAYLKSEDSDRETAEFYASTYLMTEEEIHEYMDINIGYDAVELGLQNTLKIIDRIKVFDLRKPLRIPYIPLDNTEPNLSLVNKYEARIPLLRKYAESEIISDRHLARDIVLALEKDEYLRTDKAFDSINDCMNAIEASSSAMNVHWSAYLEQIKTNIDVLWDAGITVGCGRGSGVGFVLLYMLGITGINPLRENTKTYYWRFLNPERTSVLDVDVDIESSKREEAMQAFRNAFGEDRVTKVLTITRVASRSAILIACRGLGIDNDVASYISSLIVADRGMTRDLHTMYYGDDDVKPVSEFKNLMDEYPELWNLAQKIEGLKCGVGSHAGGVVVVDEPFTNTNALMRTSSGDIVTQNDLHKIESESLIKVDLLSIDALDKIATCLKLLIKDGRITPCKTWRETVDKYIGIYNLEREAPDMWKMVHEHKILSLFQMEKQSGIEALKLVKPTSVDDLAVINSAMRLMASEGATETPLQKFARYKADVSLWYKEMDEAGLTKDEQKLLEPILLNSYGICESQEKLMQLVMIPKCGGFGLKWADSLRRSVAKKNPKLFMELEKEYLENIKEKRLSGYLCKYVWYTLIYTQRGYGFLPNIKELEPFA